MRTSAPCFLLAAALLVSANVAAAQDRSADGILRALADRLDALDVVAFDHSLELNYASQGYHQTSSARGYIEWGAANALGARFRFETPTVLYVYNGSEAFSYNEIENALGVTPRPSPDNLPGVFFQGSLYTLRRALPTILSADSVETAVLSAEGHDPAFHYVEVRVPRATIGYDGGLSPISLDVTVAYVLKIDKETLLPVEVTKRDPNGDFMRTTLSAFDFDPQSPPENAWYYSSFANEDTRDMDERTGRPLIGVGETASDWTLASYPGGSEVSLSDFRGRAVLLVFWISHCGYSIGAVPTVNALSEEYGGDGLVVVSVNPYDSPDVIDLFVENHGPRYPILEQGQEVADAYGVSGYPTAVLVGPGGVVLYSGPVDEHTLRESVESLIGE